MSEQPPGFDRPASEHPSPQAEQLLRRVAEMIDQARPVPLSTSVMVNKDELLELLNEGIDRLPDELRAARWLLKERDEFLASVRGEGDEILEQARARAGAMVQRTEVVKAAEMRGRQIIEKAESDARAMRHEVEDFCDQRLASFEIILERTARTVGEGRAKLQGAGRLTGPGLHDLASEGDDAEDAEGGIEPPGFFDQDS
jgi:cell division septum initiation protein DivIVA